MSFLFLCWPTLKSTRYAWDCLPRLVFTAGWDVVQVITGGVPPSLTHPLRASVVNGCSDAFRLFSYSRIRLMGNRADGVLNVLFRMKSAYRKFDRKCHFGAVGLVRSTQVAFVIPFGAKTHPLELGTLMGTVGNPVPAPRTDGFEQPGPSPGTGMGPTFETVGVVVGLPFSPALLAATAKALEFRMASG